MRPVAFTLFLGPALAAAPACFNPPAGQVQFSCEPDGASQCPAGYECRSDGCCHQAGSPEGDAEAECKLGGGGGATEPATAGSSTGTTAAATSTGPTTGTPGTTGDATSGTSATATTGSTSSSTSTSTGPQTSGTT